MPLAEHGVGRLRCVLYPKGLGTAHLYLPNERLYYKQGWPSLDFPYILKFL